MATKVLNLQKLIKKCGDIGKIDLTEPITDGTLMVQATAKDLAPNKSGLTPSDEPSQGIGTLTESIHAIIERVLGAGGVIGRVFTNLEYAPYIEFGTVFMLAQPFMFPALRAEQRQIVENVEDFMNKNLIKISNS